MSAINLKVTLRHPAEGSFQPKNSDGSKDGEMRDYKQIQGEYVDPETRAIMIYKVSVPQDMWPVLDQVEKMEGKHVLLDVRNFNGKYTLASTEIIPLEAINLTKKAS